MKANKVLLGSFILAGLASACTNDEIVVAEQGNNVDLSGRTQVNLSLGLPMESRMAAGANGFDVYYTPNDLLGAVLVDGGYDAGKTNNVDWTIVDGHVGNNKWAYSEANKRFETEGTTAVGAWLFYTKYNEDMTTSRDGVKFRFPQIQEGAVDHTMLANNNINFFVSPVLAIDGYEGSKIDLTLKYASIYNYLNIQLDFNELKDEKSGAEVNRVQKIVVKATNKDGQNVYFPTYGKIMASKLPIAKLSLDVNDEVAVKNHNTDNVIDKEDQNIEIEQKYQELRYKNYEWNKGVRGESTDATKLWSGAIDYTPFVAQVGNNSVEYLVVDCESEHADVAGLGGLEVKEGLFDAWMLMPVGVYGSITMEIYTNLGVYTKTVETRNAFIENEEVAEGKEAKGEAKGEGEIFLRPNVATKLSNIEGVAPVVEEGGEEISEYLKITAEDAKETQESDIVTKTADLINFINGITATGEQEVTVITQNQIGDQSNGVDDEEIEAHTAVVINKAVMDAIDLKEAELKGDIQLIFNSVKPIAIIGGGTADDMLAIHDLTFNNSCVVVSGYVNAASQGEQTSLIIPDGQKMVVKNGATLELNNVLQKEDTFANLIVETGAYVKVKKYLWINNVENKGTIVVENELESGTLTNWGAITANKELIVKGSLVNKKYATITNNAKFALETEGSGSSNYGTIINNSVLNVDSDLANIGTITNVKGASILVDNVASLNNAVNAVITNEGSMYCISGTEENKINNLGTIYAKEGSTTYITTNSSENEKVNATNSLDMGTIVLDRRNEDVSVTEGTQQGYIQYAVPTDVTELKYQANDKFNKVVLSANTTLNRDMNNRVKYIVVNSAIELTLDKTAIIQEIDFNASTILYAERVEQDGAKIALVNVAKNVEVKVPTENVINIKDVETELQASSDKKFESKTLADINNKGTILVGGDLYSTLPAAITVRNGTFASGDGNNTAFHWATGETASDYVVIGSNAKVANQAGLVSALSNTNVETITLMKGEYTFPSLRKKVTIECQEGTVFTDLSKLNIAGSTVIGATFSNPTNTAVDGTINGVFKNCTFTGKNGLRWCYAGETVVFENCIFDGSLYGAHFDSGANEIIFKDCTFSGFNAFGAQVTHLTFEGCTFKSNGKSSYNGANLWGSTSMIDCKFIFDGSAETEWIDCISEDKTYTFQNCEINGVKYTNENYKDFINYIDSRNNVTAKIDGEDCEF